MLCKNGLKFKRGFVVNALIGITIDERETFLVKIEDMLNDAEHDRCDSDHEGNDLRSGVSQKRSLRKKCSSEPMKRQHVDVNTADELDDVSESYDDLHDVKDERHDCMSIKQEQFDDDQSCADPVDDDQSCADPVDDDQSCADPVDDGKLCSDPVDDQSCSDRRINIVDKQSNCHFACLNQSQSATRAEKSIIGGQSQSYGSIPDRCFDGGSQDDSSSTWDQSLTNNDNNTSGCQQVRRVFACDLDRCVACLHVMSTCV